MVNQPIIIGDTSLTDYLIVILYYNSAPLVEVQRIVKAPADNRTNFMFVDVDPGMATISWFESSDGAELTRLISSFQIQISKQIAVFKERWYTVGGSQTDENGNIVDPIPGERTLTDPYLDGKVVTSLTKRGVGPIREGKEWSRTDNTLTLLNPENQLPDGPVFVEDDEWLALLTFLQDVVVQSPQTKIFYDEITVDTVLTPAHRNKWLYVNGSATRLKLTAEAISIIADGEWYGVICNGGNQFQTVFEVEEGNGDAINVNGQDESSVVIGRFERWQIFKRGTKFDVLHGLEYMTNIGQTFHSQNRTEINALWADAVDRNGDDYPRIYKRIKEMPDSINSPTVLTDKEGCFYWWETEAIPGEIVKHFRTPNYQNAFIRGLKDFDGLGADSTRINDVPGGKQFGQTAEHRHLTVVPNGINSNTFPANRNPATNPTPNNSIREWWQKNDGGGKESYVFDTANAEPSVSRTSKTGEGISSEGYPTNYGEFIFIRI